MISIINILVLLSGASPIFLPIHPTLGNFDTLIKVDSEKSECEYEVFLYPTDGKDPLGYDSATNSHSEYWVADCFCIFNGWDHYQQAILDSTTPYYGHYATYDDPGGIPQPLTRFGSYERYKTVTCKRNC